LEMGDLCVWAHFHKYWRRLLRKKRLGVIKLGSGGVGKARRIVAAGVFAWDDDDAIVF
jgi:hypothetical protein